MQPYQFFNAATRISKQQQQGLQTTINGVLKLAVWCLPKAAPTCTHQSSLPPSTALKLNPSPQINTTTSTSPQTSQPNYRRPLPQNKTADNKDPCFYNHSTPILSNHTYTNNNSDNSRSIQQIQTSQNYSRRPPQLNNSSDKSTLNQTHACNDHEQRNKMKKRRVPGRKVERKMAGLLANVRRFIPPSPSHDPYKEKEEIEITSNPRK